MNAQEYKKFAAEKRVDFFKKYPKPSKQGARAFWKNTLECATNQLNTPYCGRFGQGAPASIPTDFFDKAAKQILKYLV